MSDPIYKPPETNPEKEGLDVVESKGDSSYRLLLACSAFIPSVIYAAGVAIFGFRGKQEDAFVYVVMVLAVVLAVYTAYYQYSRSERGVLLMIAYVFRWFIVHTVVLFMGLLVVTLLRFVAL